ncbi:hypothetical protein [Lusitaniella coriacea]|uniref:hypothetical protein n=1 Tax=Lusitaniella coriacea TaxID=1983105 RepID=UPI003CEF0FA8
MKILQETPIHLEIQSSSENMAANSCLIIFVAFYFILLLYLGWFQHTALLNSNLRSRNLTSCRLSA